MAWIYLLAAVALDVTWATGLKKLTLNFSWIGTMITVIAMIASLLALYAAIMRLSPGIAYPNWTGIGSVGSVVVGVMAYNQTLGLSGVLGLALLVI